MQQNKLRKCKKYGSLQIENNVNKQSFNPTYLPPSSEELCQNSTKFCLLNSFVILNIVIAWKPLIKCSFDFTYWCTSPSSK